MIVLDTNVLVSALKSKTGSSRIVLRGVLLRETIAVVSVPVFLEYEAVLTRPEICDLTGLSPDESIEFLDGLAEVLCPTEVSYLWRPRLRDPKDECVLEAAVNGGADGIVTWNERDFLPAALDFGLWVATPAEYLKQIERKGRR